jgi:hypothetical protein
MDATYQTSACGTGLSVSEPIFPITERKSGPLAVALDAASLGVFVEVELQLVTTTSVLTAESNPRQ